MQRSNEVIKELEAPFDIVNDRDVDDEDIRDTVAPTTAFQDDPDRMMFLGPLTLLVSVSIAALVASMAHPQTSPVVIPVSGADPVAPAIVAPAAPVQPPVAAPKLPLVPSQAKWVAAAPGRVEPKSGEIKVSSAISGRVVEVLVKVRNQVDAGDALIVLDDEEARARVAAAEAEAGVRRRERDAGTLITGREDVRRAGDLVADAERAVVSARASLDKLLRGNEEPKPTPEAIAEARKVLEDARLKLRSERDGLVAAQSRPGLANPNRLESALAAARADLSAADAMFEKTRIRSPISGRALQVLVKAGETVSPSAEQSLVIVGDTSGLRVKAEVDERDLAKIRTGQKVFVSADGFAGKTFEGTVTALAPSLAPPRIGQRGARRATDVEVLEVTIDLDDETPLLPGMRVDAFFRN